MDSTNIIKIINKSEQNIDTIYNLSCYRFIRLTSDLSFVPNNLKKLVVIYKFNNPIKKLNIECSDPTIKFVTGDMRSLSSIDKVFGYIFEFDTKNYVQGPGYFGVTNKTKNHLHETKVLLKSKNLYIFESDWATLCIGKVHESLVEDYGWNRGAT